MSSWSMGSVLRTTNRTTPLGTRTRVLENRLWWMVRATVGTAPRPERGAGEAGAAARVAATAARDVARSARAPTTGGRLTGEEAGGGRRRGPRRPRRRRPPARSLVGAPPAAPSCGERPATAVATPWRRPA